MMSIVEQKNGDPIQRRISRQLKRLSRSSSEVGKEFYDHVADFLEQFDSVAIGIMRAGGKDWWEPLLVKLYDRGKLPDSDSVFDVVYDRQRNGFNEPTPERMRGLYNPGTKIATLDDAIGSGRGAIAWHDYLEGLGVDSDDILRPFAIIDRVGLSGGVCVIRGWTYKDGQCGYDPNITLEKVRERTGMVRGNGKYQTPRYIGGEESGEVILNIIGGCVERS
ncbi:MAG: hypothetical protein ABIH90_00920 [Candidatus Aenigmatarchaeota archaeon]